MFLMKNLKKSTIAITRNQGWSIFKCFKLFEDTTLLPDTRYMTMLCREVEEEEEEEEEEYEEEEEEEEEEE